MLLDIDKEIQNQPIFDIIADHKCADLVTSILDKAMSTLILTQLLSKRWRIVQQYHNRERNHNKNVRTHVKVFVSKQSIVNFSLYWELRYRSRS